MIITATFEVENEQTVYCFVNGIHFGNDKISIKNSTVSYEVDGYWSKNLITFLFPENQIESKITVKEVSINSLYLSIMPRVFFASVFVSNLDQVVDTPFTNLTTGHECKGPGLFGIKYPWPLEEWYFKT